MPSASARDHVIDALDKLISARKEAVELILKRFAAKYADDFDAVDDAALEVAMRELKKASKKIPPWHPDSEEWTRFEELRSVAAAAREKPHDMTEEARRAWVSETTAKVREHAAQIDGALQRFRQEMLENPAAHVNPESKLSEQEKQILATLRAVSPDGLCSKLIAARSGIQAGRVRQLLMLNKRLRTLGLVQPTPDGYISCPQLGSLGE
jgi:hypothetical protein